MFKINIQNSWTMDTLNIMVIKTQLLISLHSFFLILMVTIYGTNKSFLSTFFPKFLLYVEHSRELCIHQCTIYPSVYLLTSCPGILIFLYLLMVKSISFSSYLFSLTFSVTSVVGLFWTPKYIYSATFGAIWLRRTNSLSPQRMSSNDSENRKWYIRYSSGNSITYI